MHTFMMQWLSACESFSLPQTASRKRLTRPSSRPSPSPFFVSAATASSRARPAVVDQPGDAFRQVVRKRPPTGVREARARKADEVVQHGEAPAGAAPSRASAVVVLRWQPDPQLADVGVAERVVLEHLRFV